MRPNGFTLIELIVGIVVMAVALAFLSASYLPLASRSVDPLLEMKASELASAFFSELRSKRFDENSDPDGGQLRCDETGQAACTVQASFGPDGAEASRQDFDDIDDYHGLSLIGDAIESINGTPLVGKYSDYRVNFQVSYQGGLLGLNATAAKLVTITITLPKGNQLRFSTIRSNY